MKISTTFDYNQVQFDKENEVVLIALSKNPVGIVAVKLVQFLNKATQFTKLVTPVIGLSGIVVKLVAP